MRTILAVDPSLTSTGYALLDADTDKIIAKGKINVSKDYNVDTRIQLIVHELSMVLTNNLKNVKSDLLCLTMEDGFVGTNARGSLNLAELRGAIIFYFMENGFEVFHNKPSEIRKNLGLKGNAKKEEVAARIQEIYPDLEKDIGPYSDKNNKGKTSDIYDAISIGLSYLNLWRVW